MLFCWLNLAGVPAPHIQYKGRGGNAEGETDLTIWPIQAWITRLVISVKRGNRLFCTPY